MIWTEQKIVFHSSSYDPFGLTYVEVIILHL